MNSHSWYIITLRVLDPKHRRVTNSASVRSLFEKRVWGTVGNITRYPWRPDMPGESRHVPGRGRLFIGYRSRVCAELSAALCPGRDRKSLAMAAERRGPGLWHHVDVKRMTLVHFLYCRVLKEKKKKTLQNKPTNQRTNKDQPTKTKTKTYKQTYSNSNHHHYHHHNHHHHHHHMHHHTTTNKNPKHTCSNFTHVLNWFS